MLRSRQRVAQKHGDRHRPHAARNRGHQTRHLEDRWINAAALPQALTADFAVTGPTEWLIATVPYSEVEISFLAAAADETIGAHLEFAPGEPVFCVERTTWWQGQAITHVRLYFRRGHRMTTRY